MFNVYKIQCKDNGKIYIGQTNCFNRRVSQHKKCLCTNTHSNPFLQKDYNTYGSTSFIYSIVETCETRAYALERETYWINYYGGIDCDLTYNVKGNDRDNREYAKRKTKNLTHDNFKGHTHTSQSKHKTSESLKLAYKTGKHVLSGAISENNCGPNNSFYGKHHTDETKQLLSKLKLGKRKYSEQFIDSLISEYRIVKDYNYLSSKYSIPLSTIEYLINYKNDYIKYGLNNKPKLCDRCND